MFIKGKSGQSETTLLVVGVRRKELDLGVANKTLPYISQDCLLISKVFFQKPYKSSFLPKFSGAKSTKILNTRIWILEFNKTNSFLDPAHPTLRA
jgi:hypothetical protein